MVRQPEIENKITLKNKGLATATIKLKTKKSVINKHPFGKKTEPPIEIKGSIKNMRTAERKKRYLPSDLKKQTTIKPKYFFKTDLPSSYDKTYLKAIVQDPSRLFVYWEIARNDIASAKKRFGERWFESSKKILRVFAVSNSHNSNFSNAKYSDIVIYGFNDSMYINVSHPGRTYIIQCGLLFPDNYFFILVQSNEVTTPPNTISNNIDEKWFIATTDGLIALSEKQLFTAPTSERVKPKTFSNDRKLVPEFIGASENFYVGSSFYR